MKSLVNIFFAVLVVGALSSPQVQAQNEQIRFAVNMEYANLDPGDQVVVRGNLPRLGNWTSEGELVLRPTPDNANIYRGNTRLNTSAEVLYKYVIIKSDGTEVWEQSGNRVLDPSQSSPVWFSDRNRSGISQLFVNVTFRLDLNEHTMDGHPTEGVALMGMHAPLSFELETGRTEMAQTSEGIWEITIGFPYGTPHDMPFKFAWYHEGEWRWEWRAGHTNHVFWIDDSSTEQTISLKYDVELPGVIPDPGTSGFVDDYAYMISQLGENGPASRYGYELAIQQLRAGNRQAAEATYTAYRAGHPGGEEIDDFDYEMAYHIERTEGPAAADRFVEEKLTKETISERRSYLRYLRGELALRRGEGPKARRLLRQALQQSDWELAGAYSRQALVASYLRETDPDSVQRGMRMLRRYAAQAPPENRRRYATQLARVYQRVGMIEQQEEVLNELATSGNTRQQVKGKLDLATFFIEQSRYTEAVGLLDAVEYSSGLPDRVHLQVTRQRIHAYFNLEMYQQVITTYQAYATTWPEDAYRKRLHTLYDQATEQVGTPEFETPQMEPVNPDSTRN